nr:homoserine dehydrogenase [Actinomycetota bacterium]NIS32838.1 homoserine dehydrogenase [Actinomycetota bacterium]NIT96491.1 homoserine dehydrogenase [Actinomycetota bacterium]NIU20188.1 homoserine dehydrogenase [Actinomycetota bacterium]NIU67813.1 homoserine dehydrogenase [Actinomycetota bacterium]
VDLRVARIAVRSTSKERHLDLPPEVFTTDAMAVVEDPDIDLVVELIGGIEPARALIRRAIELGKPVVTGNKELLANHGAELFAAADAAGVDLLFEAAVAGGIPLMRPLRESLVGEPVRRVLGIVNGTTNYILTRMSEEGVSYADALAEAQSLGYAERDPTADVEGFDAGAKAAIIATIVFGAVVVAGDVYHEGISAVTTDDIAIAARLGYVVKAVAIVERCDSQPGDPFEVAVRVHPALVPDTHPLATVRLSFNAVFVEGDAVGELMLFGRGAGGRPTASAVLGDVIDAAINRVNGSAGRIGTLAPARIRPIDELSSAYYLGVEVRDQPGVLASVADVFGRHGVSIRSMEQQGLGDQARLIFITHRSVESAVQATLHELRELDVVNDIHAVLRVVGDED